MCIRTYCYCGDLVFIYVKCLVHSTAHRKQLLLAMIIIVLNGGCLINNQHYNLLLDYKKGPLRQNVSVRRLLNILNYLSINTGAAEQISQS